MLQAVISLSIKTLRQNYRLTKNSMRLLKWHDPSLSMSRLVHAPPAGLKIGESKKLKVPPQIKTQCVRAFFQI